MTTTTTLKAWIQKPHSSVIPSPNVASRIMRPVHVNDHATTVAASMVAAVRGPLRVTPAIASNATVATPPNRSRSEPRYQPTESPSDPCLVIDGMDLDPDEDVPQEAAERGWNTELGVDSIRGVIDNLRLQLGHSADITLILRAVAHYVDNDAFLTVE